MKEKEERVRMVDIPPQLRESAIIVVADSLG
jgi:membrane-associated HD superfamily phosphohydrolase